MACQNTAPSCANQVIMSSINSIDKKRRSDTSEDVICAVTIFHQNCCLNGEKKSAVRQLSPM